ncbi:MULTISPECIES: peptidylprolyl isomerase PrsA [unclassified Lactobacillus]|uniref:peptidylprolyl isomerase PrsA n=1 Tax=unclassified Lactobacillus TaxID=2620435 RepID=UPI000EFAD57B|nr:MULTISPECIES: peptidylprolyl isomerase PrsA [unclassified Lactobacillus]RMC24225.1 peptidylprolyl isomerase [Lactobacillus sp. ESL0247]RMC28798.1 peptidylprolyl isomerase [Lactobacillus sp. ESL0246]RMC31455.1 peptidylprolyl isomerase [Lactobacillus sp. ESL0245]
MNKYIKRLAAVVAVAGIALSTAACSNGGKTVASYKGGKITQQDYYEELKKSQAGKTTLANMIINRALEQQYGSKVSSSQVDKQFNNYKKQYGSQFDAVLQQNGMTASSFKQSLKTNLLTEAALKDVKKISKSQEDKVWKTYEPKVTVQHILVSKKSKAEQVISELKDGKSFKSLVKKYSLDTATKPNDGKLPAFDSTDSTLDPAFKAAAFKLKTGQTTKTPVKSQSGYHIIRMIDHPDKGSFASHKKNIDDQIYRSMSQNQEVMRSVISTVLKKSDPQIKDKDLQDALSSYISTPENKK